jgi:hypothetical protein
VPRGKYCRNILAALASALAEARSIFRQVKSGDLQIEEARELIYSGTIVDGEAESAVFRSSILVECWHDTRPYRRSF